ncbi:MAG: gliding motility-associated C-terminal domain-containing protein [Flavobacteriales bacterium]|nr:MAG: gliding motility-associated C-terminal domain-containing protein [Flavobacteriales bacterium]
MAMASFLRPLAWGWLSAASVLVGMAQPLDPPALRCASVNVAGNVTLTWTPPVDPNGDFQAYEIWSANNPLGPFSVISTVAVYGQTTFFHAGAGANAGPQFYFMTTLSGGPPPETSLASDTVATLFLQVFQSTPLGNANLSWNAPAISSSSSNVYSIWLEYPVGVWSQVASVPVTTFSYQWPVSICEDSLTFRVGLSDLSGCVSFSNRDGEVFQDVTPPSVPVIVAASVDSITGLSTVSWTASPEPDTDGYIIVYNGPGGGVIIDTVFGQFNTSYAWPDSWPFGSSESFTIAAFDTCETGTPPSPNTSATGPPHATMLAETTYDRCGARMRITWSPYVGWSPQSHQILAQYDGGAWVLLANLPAAANSYEHDVQPGHQYCYIVKAIQAPGQAFSLSNEACRFTDYPPLPGGNYLRTVTVTSPSTILIVDSVDVTAQVSAYRLERSVNGGAFEMQATFPGSAGPVITYVDEDVAPSQNGYRYRMLVQDSCGRPSVTSNLGGNILLRAVPGLDGINRLDWNGYQAWAGAVAGYGIHRSIDRGTFELIAVLPPDPWTYADDVNAFVGLTGDFCYRVEAIEAGNPSGVNATSMSNEACAFQEELVYIPNAFIIGSAYNPVFKPVIGFVDIAEYRLLIINRWGQVVWETEDPGQAWDGIVGSQVMPIGVYGYYCSVRNGAGKLVEKHGTVTLLRAD